MAIRRGVTCCYCSLSSRSTSALPLRACSRVRATRLSPGGIRMVSYCRLESGDERVIFSNGVVLHQLQCLSTFGAAWLEAIADFGASLRRHAIDISTLACMAALALITCTIHTHTYKSYQLATYRAWRCIGVAVSSVLTRIACTSAGCGLFLCGST